MFTKDEHKLVFWMKAASMGNKLVDYLRNNLIPDLNPDDIVIMDSLRSHKVKEVKESFEKKKLRFSICFRTARTSIPLNKCGQKARQF